VKLLEPRHPERLEARHSCIVESLLEIGAAGHQDALNAIIVMLEDLTIYRLESRFVKHLKGTPIWELKTRARGGLKGGARVYWFPLEIVEDQTEASETHAVIVTAEVKAGNEPDQNKLQQTLEVYLAFKRDASTMLRRST
jgi:hypothetical protein